jgi:hypothetical protein
MRHAAGRRYPGSLRLRLLPHDSRPRTIYAGVRHLRRAGC